MSTITVEAAVAWARLPQGAMPIYWAHRLSAVRGFAAYLHTIDPRHEVPPKRVLAVRQQRQPPFLFTATDITRLLNASAALTPTRRGATYRAF
jgi:site-specific recombinase XerC